jgi:glycosyltransferase involved in cell wall biosynthesis
MVGDMAAQTQIPRQEVRVGIVVPCFNEEQVLPETARRLCELMTRLTACGKMVESSQLYLVDDGSTDNTWPVIEMLVRDDTRIAGIKLSRNQGHQKALLAGLLSAEGDVVISIDADLQDDVNAIDQMLDAFVAGHDVVYGVRENRGSDTLFKRLSAETYYRLLHLMGVEAMFNHADYRLLSRRAIEHLSAFGESNVFLRGIIPLIGLPSAKVSYSRRERFAGESKYSLRKMLALAFEGVTSFSTTPLRMITVLGLVVFVVSGCLGVWGLYTALSRNAVPGWASTVVPIYFLGSVQLLSIGIIGEYLAKMYMEVKRRPRYIIEKMI